ncbi:MAG TPA: vitamin K epoxide reductase family protein, partial [Solirubrobacteraceae bacterium]|nr:vitamin K epoxide reductase family protein [Solirubrobacteraceae bacterium]
AILASLLVRETETSRFATLVFTLAGFGFSAYLTYRELFSIHAVCEWCATSAGIMTILMVLSVWRFLRGDGSLDRPRIEAGEGARPAQVSVN